MNDQSITLLAKQLEAPNVRWTSEDEDELQADLLLLAKGELTGEDAAILTGLINADAKVAEQFAQCQEAVRFMRTDEGKQWAESAATKALEALGQASIGYIPAPSSQDASADILLTSADIASQSAEAAPDQQELPQPRIETCRPSNVVEFAPTAQSIQARNVQFKMGVYRPQFARKLPDAAGSVESPRDYSNLEGFPFATPHGEARLYVNLREFGRHATATFALVLPPGADSGAVVWQRSRPHGEQIEPKLLQFTAAVPKLQEKIDAPPDDENWSFSWQAASDQQ